MESRDEESVSDTTIPTMFTSTVRLGPHRAPGRMGGSRGLWRWRHRAVTRSRRNPPRVPTSSAGGVGQTRACPGATHLPVGEARDRCGDQGEHGVTCSASQCANHESPRFGVARMGLRSRPDRLSGRSGTRLATISVVALGLRRVWLRPARGVCTEVVAKLRSHRDVRTLVRCVAVDKSRPTRVECSSRDRFRDMTPPRGCVEGARNPKGGQLDFRRRARSRRMASSMASEGSP